MRSPQKVSKMLESLFNIFAVTKLTEEELIESQKHMNIIYVNDPDVHRIQYKKAEIAKKIVHLINEIKFIEKLRNRKDKNINK